MEKLSTSDWSLIARYLNEEASQKDMDRLTDLIERTKDLRSEMVALRKRMNMNMPVAHGSNVFDANDAFYKLERRLRSDGLI